MVYFLHEAAEPNLCIYDTQPEQGLIHLNIIIMKEQLRYILERVKQLSWRKKLVVIPFLICAIFLLATGKVFRLTYKEISVVFNLWVQGAVLMLSSFLPLAACVVCLTNGITVFHLLLTLFFLVYALINIWAFVGMVKHYGSNKDYAFDLCMHELQRIAASWGVSYHMANLIIFILFYLIVIGINVILAHYVWLIS